MSDRRDPIGFKLPRFPRGPMVRVSSELMREIGYHGPFYSISAFGNWPNQSTFVWIDARRLKRERRRSER